MTDISDLQHLDSWSAPSIRALVRPHLAGIFHPERPPEDVRTQPHFYIVAGWRGAAQSPRVRACCAAIGEEAREVAAMCAVETARIERAALATPGTDHLDALLEHNSAAAVIQARPLVQALLNFRGDQAFLIHAPSHYYLEIWTGETVETRSCCAAVREALVRAHTGILHAGYHSHGDMGENDYQY